MARNPVERERVNIGTYLDKERRAAGKPMVDWQTWIYDDLRLLNETGVRDAKKTETKNDRPGGDNHRSPKQSHDLGKVVVRAANY